MKLSLTIPSKLSLERFFVVMVSNTSSITPYPESSVATSNDGLNTPVVLGIHTLGATFVPLVVSFHSPIADNLPINASAIVDTN